MLVTDISDDCLRRIATRVLEVRHAYWFACTCTAFRNHLHAAAAESELAIVTCLSSAFCSGRMLFHAIAVPGCRELIVANQNAFSYHALVQSADCKYRWQPTAIRHAFRFAPREVLDYMAPQWQQNRDDKPLEYAAAAGRVFMLEEMASLKDSMLKHHVETFALGEPGRTCELFDRYIFKPAIIHGSTKTLQWFFSKVKEMDELAEAMSVVCSQSMRGLSRCIGSADQRYLATFTIRMLDSAVSSEHAVRMLGYLTSSILPQALRVTMMQHWTLQQSLLAIVLALCSNNDDVHVNAWRWLKMQSSSAYSMWQTLDAMGRDSAFFNPPARIDSRRVLNKLLCAGTGDVYRWMCDELDEGGWLNEIFYSHLHGLPRTRPVTESMAEYGLQPRTAFAWGTMVYCDTQDSYGSAYVAARVDCLLRMHELPNVACLECPDRASANKIFAICDCMNEFFERATEIPVPHRFKALEWASEVHVIQIATRLVQNPQACKEGGIERLRRCLLPRSDGGYGACGMSMTIDSRMTMSQTFECLCQQVDKGSELLHLFKQTGVWTSAIAGVGSALDKDELAEEGQRGVERAALQCHGR